MGQTHGRHRTHSGSRHDEVAPGLRPSSSPTPGSPLTYSPQMPMEPMHRPEELQRRGSGFAQTEFAGWTAQPKLVPTVITWSHGGADVQVEGSFDRWTKRHTMQKSGKDYTIVQLLPPGVYQYKFIVDGQWRHDPNLPSMYDEMGNVNNVMEVQEYTPEYLGGLSGFDPPPSPPHSYSSPASAPEDFLKEPPAMPAQLQLSLLNVPPALDAIAALPRPQHVILNHVYLQRSAGVTTAMVVGATHRYQSKYITTVMYKPRGSSRLQVQPGAGSQPIPMSPSAAAGQHATSQRPSQLTSQLAAQPAPMQS